MEKEIRSLRIHHLLCIPLFVGEGYSDAFSKNMTRIIQLLKREADAPLRAVCGPDMICAGCPNLKKDGSCGNSTNNQVVQKDTHLAELFGIRSGESYTFQRLLKMAQENLTEEEFEASCGNCEWYRQGLCSYEKWALALEKRIITGNS